LKLKRQSRLLTYVNSYSETFSAGCTSVKGKIWVIYRKFSDKLPVIYGNGNISNLTGNFQTLATIMRLVVQLFMCTISCVQWVSESGRPHSRSASLKVDANKFAPQGSNPNELREKVKEVNVRSYMFVYSLFIILTISCCK